MTATPTRLRQLTVLTAALVVALATLTTLEAFRARDGTSRISSGAAPVVLAATDLYFALNDMDAQVANVLLVGDATDLGITRADAAAIYDKRRLQVDGDLQRVAAAGGDVRGLLDALGRYLALTAEAMLPGRAGTDARDSYRAATTLLATTVLPRAQAVIDEQSRGLTADYSQENRRTTVTRIALVVSAGLLLAALVVFQMFLARKFRRDLNPRLLGAAAVVTGLLLTGLVVLGQHGQRLHTQQHDAFDSIIALTRARALSYDANADESRFLLDPDPAYERSFLAKTQQILQLPGATLGTYDQRLGTSWTAYQQDHRQVGWGGSFGAEFRNLTFAGERGAAEAAVAEFQAYQLDDRRIRELASTGRRVQALRLCTSYAPGGSNYAFDRYDQALNGIIAINTRAYGTAVDDDRRDLSRWRWVPGIAALIVLALLVAGVRPRLAEYR